MSVILGIDLGTSSVKAMLLDSVKGDVYKRQPFNGGRWMMIEVRNGEVLEDVKELIGIRMRKKRSV